MLALAIGGCSLLSDGDSVEEAYRLEFPDGVHTLVVAHVGEPVFPYGEDRMKVAVMESVQPGSGSSEKEIAAKVFSVLNDGARGEFSVSWGNEYVLVTLTGSEMEEKIYLTVSYGNPSEIVQWPVEPAAKPEAIDLGLSVLWASMNVGGEKEYKHGYHYKWSGELSSRIETVLGEGWRLPTAEELQELIDVCNLQVIKSADVDGVQVIGRKPGYYDKKLFLPFSGMEVGEEVVELRISGGYWSSTSLPEPGSDKECPMYLSIKGERDSNGIMRTLKASVEVMSSLTSGLSVRAVRDKE